AFSAAAQAAGEAQGPYARGLRPRILRRLQLRREGSRQARRRARAVQAHGRQAAGNERRAGAAAEPARPQPARFVADHRRRIRQQDLGEMPVKTVAGGRLVVHLALLVAVVAAVLLMAGLLDAALAQTSPFGAPRSQAPAPPLGGVLGWIFAKQAEFYL